MEEGTVVKSGLIRALIFCCWLEEKQREGGVFSVVWWNYLICYVCLVIGKLQAAYSIIIPMICVNFGFPFTTEIEQNTGVSTTRVRNKLKKTISFWAIINFAAFVVLYYFVPLAYSLAYTIGALLTIFNIGQTKKNSTNICDYYNAYINDFPAEHRERVENYLKEKGYIQ